MKSLKNIIRVVFGNVAVLLSGIFVSLFLPKIISVTDYGFYKVFSLYYGYLGVLSLGIIDGIVLKYGNMDYDGLNREKMRRVFSIYSFIHIIFVLLLILISLIFLKKDYQFIFLMLGATLLPANYTGYFQQISQITQRFKEYSSRKIIQSILNVAFLSVLIVLVASKVVTIDYKVYIIGSVLITVILCVWYLVTYREIVFGKKESVKEGVIETIGLAKIGLPLLVANLCSTLLLSLDRQFVSVLFSTEEYATYSFAYSMLSLITVAVSSVSTVIYPLFKRYDEEKLLESYSVISEIVLIVVFAMMLVYNPLCYFVEWFLPKYANSLIFLRIILPGVALSSMITIVLHNYYKVLGKNFLYFMISVIILAISIGLNVAAFYIFGNREAISIASIITTVFWYLIVSIFINKKCKFSIKNNIYSALMIGSFYLSTWIELHWISFLVQIFSFAAVTIVLYYKDFSIIKSVLKTNH